MVNKKSIKKIKDPKKVAWGKMWQKKHKNELKSKTLNSVKPEINELNQRVKYLESRKTTNQTRVVKQVLQRNELNIPIKLSLFENIFGIKIPLVEIKKEENSKNKTFTLNRLLKNIGLELSKHNSRLNIHRKKIGENKIITEEIQKDRKKEKNESAKIIKKLEEKISNLENKLNSLIIKNIK